MPKITKRFVETIIPDSEKTLKYWDTELRGFGLIVLPSGLGLSIVGKLLGHTQASTTQRYAHLADESLRQAAELFGSKVGHRTAKDA